MRGSGKHAVILALCAGIIGFSGCAKKGGDLNVQESANAANATAQESASGELVDTDGKPCISHKMCSPGSACVQDKCVRIDAITCTTDLDCPEFDMCNNGHCVGCASDSDCMKDFTCNSHGVCVPKALTTPICQSSMDCGNGEVCRDGMCQAFCTSSWGACPRSYGCLSANNMLVGVCINEELTSFRSACSEDKCEFNCGEGKVFLSNAICYPEICKLDSDCNEGKYCSDGICKNKECESNEDCREGVCQHYVCGCSTNADCSEEQYCNHGKCERYQCETDEDCSFYDKVCQDRKCVTCKSDNDCSDGKHCKEAYSYSDRTCGEHECVFGEKSKAKALKCVECEEDKDCPSDRSHCDLYMNVCVACLTDGDCQDGYECEDHQKCVKSDDDKLHKKVQACASNADCGEGNYCSYEHECKPMAKKCTSDGDCEEGVSCNRHGYCSAEPVKFWGMPLPEICSTDEHCGRMGGAVCTTHLRRVYDPAKGENIDGHICAYLCTKAEDCEKGESCIFGICTVDYERHLCSVKSDCPSGYECNTFYHECIIPRKVDESMDVERTMSLMEEMKRHFHVAKTPVECMKNSDCKDGLSCLANGKCGCTTNEQCPVGNMCSTDLSCECLSDSGCHSGFICMKKKSHVFRSHGFNSMMCACSSDEVCGENKICNMDGACVDGNNAREVYARALDYHYGFVHAANLEKAVELYQKSETLGNSFATIQLALIDYEKNKDAKKWNDKVQKALEKIDAMENAEDEFSDDPITALLKSLWLKKSDIIYLKAMLTIYGIGVKKDVNKGIEMLTEASDYYSVFARAELVDLYVSGKIVPKNLEKARKILEDAYGEYDYPESGYGYYRIAKILAKTPKLMEDKMPEIILEYLATASSIGLLEAKYQISAFYGVSNRWSVEFGGDAYRKRLLEFVKKMGHPEAAKRLEMVQTFSVKMDDSDVSKDILLKEAKQGNAIACYLLQKKYQDNKCAEALSKQGFLVGDYLMMLK